MTKPRILILIKGLGLGGAERLLVNALPYLSRDEFDYQVGYFLPWKDALVPEFESQGIPVTCFDCRTPYTPNAIRKVRGFLREHQISLLHSHLPSASIAGRIASRLGKSPATVYTEHGCWNRLHPLTRGINRLTLGWNDLTIAVSEEVRDSMDARSRTKTVVIDNGIDCLGLARTPNEREAVCQEFGISPSNFLIVKVANLSPVKNHEMLIRAFAKMRQSIPDSTLLLVGQLRDRSEQLKQLAESLGVGPQVQILGPRTDAPRIVKAADLFAMSSTSEGLPVSLLEAMALEKPVVCTRVGGIPGVVTDAKNGMLVASGDFNHMADCFIRLASDQDLRAEIARTAAEDVRQRYDVTAMAANVENEYRRLLRRRLTKLP